MENINKIQIVPDEVYEIGADKVPVIPEWSVKDDETLYKKVNKLAHSTFDKSKFTVIGTPNITDDGIASGFSTSNYLRFNKNVTGNNWVIKTKSYLLNDIQGQTIIQAYSTDNVIARKHFQIQPYNNTVYVYIGDGTNQQVFYTEGFIYDNWIWINVIKENNKYYIEISTDGINFVRSSGNDVIYELNESLFNVGISTNTYLRGSVDLKQFSITVDGEEIFNGNKQGMDTIKPDDYTVVGTPTISADGVASGFSGSNFVAKTLTSITANKFSIISSFITPSTLSSNVETIFISFYNGTTAGISAFVNNGKLAGFVNNGSQYIAATANGSYQLSTNTRYWVKLEFTGSAYKLHYSLDGTNYTQIWSVDASASYLQYNIRQGINASSTQSFTGSIDLNAFKIYVDGNLVYQPCLKIPYTESKTGSKIVDSIYRDRVKDLFEQEGYNIYYTLGEDDFTLPSNKPNDIVKYKANGLTVAEQRADQTLTIRGACESGTDVNLPMDFFDADSYAVFGVGTTGTNTASKFTPAADGNYIAIGKGKV